MRSEEVENGLEISPWASKRHRKRREESRRRLGSVLGASRGDSGGPLGTQDGVLEAQGQKVDLYVAWPAAEAGPLEVFDFESDRHLHLLQASVINSTRSAPC